MSPEESGPTELTVATVAEMRSANGDMPKDVGTGENREQTPQPPKRPGWWARQLEGPARKVLERHGGYDLTKNTPEQKGEALAKSANPNRTPDQQKQVDAFAKSRVTTEVAEGVNNETDGEKRLKQQVVEVAALNTKVDAKGKPTEDVRISVKRVEDEYAIIVSRQTRLTDEEKANIKNPSYLPREVLVYTMTSGNKPEISVISGDGKANHTLTGREVTNTSAQAVAMREIAAKRVAPIQIDMRQSRMGNFSNDEELHDDVTGEKVAKEDMLSLFPMMLDIQKGSTTPQDNEIGFDGWSKVNTIAYDTKNAKAMVAYWHSRERGEPVPKTVFVGDRKLADSLRDYVTLPNGISYPPKEIPTTPEARQASQQEIERSAFDDLTKKLEVTFDLSKADDRQRALDGINALYNMKTGSKMPEKDNPFAQLGLRIDAANLVSHVMRQAKSLDETQATLRAVKLRELSDPATYRRILFSYLTPEQQLQYVAEQEELALAKGREQMVRELAKEKQATPTT